jgi:hypothetical protein
MESVLEAVRWSDITVVIDCYVTRASDELPSAVHKVNGAVNTGSLPPHASRLRFNWFTGRADIEAVVKRETQQTSGSLAVTGEWDLHHQLICDSLRATVTPEGRSRCCLQYHCILGFH